MKTKNIITKTSLFVLAILISNTLYAQRGNREGNGRSKHETRNEVRVKQHNNSQYSQKKHRNNENYNKSYNHNKSKYFNQNDVYNYKTENNNNYKWHNQYRVNHKYNKQSKHVYHKNLPHKQFIKFNNGKHDYYLCDNHFYRHHPKHGYIMTETPFIIVNRLPNRYFVKVINGNTYIFANGNIYIPYGPQYILIPEHHDNQLAFALTIHF
ncbi:MAG: hypothetical protein JW717_08040 [Marinilabiliaceae bacterium]|nr:hypothetical protein [Marinilabiliaceae bacterium]